MCIPHRFACAAALVFLTIAFGACGDDTSTPTSPSGQGASALIFNNHGHVAIVTADQIRAGLAVRLDIRGTADHSHLLDLTNEDIVRLQSRQRVERDSTLENNHRHRATFN